MSTDPAAAYDALDKVADAAMVATLVAGNIGDPTDASYYAGSFGALVLGVFGVVKKSKSLMAAGLLMGAATTVGYVLRPLYRKYLNAPHPLTLSVSLSGTESKTKPAEPPVAAACACDSAPAVPAKDPAPTKGAVPKAGSPLPLPLPLPLPPSPAAKKPE